jgi:tetratricopeptide (TPR) repeat protein
MARSAQRRNRQQRERRPTPRAPKQPVARPAPRYEDTMFFPRLRRQAKWMFVFLAVVFGLGYVIFNVGGSIPGTGLGDVLQGLGQEGSVGPSAGEARDRIEDNPNDPKGYYDLAQALQRDGKNDEAITPLSRYVQLRPRDQAALNQLAGLHLTQARRAQDEALRVQFELGELTGSSFLPDQSSQFGQRFSQGEVTQLLSTELNERLSQEYIKAQEAYKKALGTYKKLVAAIPDAEEAEQPSIFLQLAFAAQSANDLKAAISAYKRYLALAPDSPQEDVVRDQIKQLREALKAQKAQTSPG